MRVSTTIFAPASMLFLFAASSNAAVIGFEGVAPVGSVLNVSPATPYSEAGFTFTPITASSGVFDSANPNTFPGDATDWFGFAAGNTITMTGPAQFNLTSLLIGPTNFATGNPNVTLTGNVFGGGTLSASFLGLTTATLEVLNWTNLTSLTIVTTRDTGIDNVTAAAVPEPGTLLLLGGGLLALALRRRRAA